MTKGFITLAVGEYYCKLAEHLYMSYKLFSGAPIFTLSRTKTAKTDCQSSLTE